MPGRPLGEAASTLGSFFERCGGIDNLFDRLCGELLSAQLSAGPTDGPHWRLGIQAHFNKAADSFGERRGVRLLFGPPNNGSSDHGFGSKPY